MAGRVDPASPESCVSDSESAVSGPVNGTSGSGDDPLVRLDENSQEHILLKHRLYSSLGSASKHCSVAAAYKVMHSTGPARARLDAFRLYSEFTAEKRSGDPNVRFAWYGASREGVDQIVRHGFEFSGDAEGAGLYGLGLYLSPERSAIDSIVSSPEDAFGLRHLLFCRVILGNTEEVLVGSKQSCPSSERFDSGVDDQSCPKRYIIWPAQVETHILPVYALSIRVKFQSRGLQTGPVRKPKSPWIPLGTLVSMLSSNLPPHRMCLIKKIHNAYLERKITRQQLICHVRRLSGDRLLVSAIRAFQVKQMKAGIICTVKKSTAMLIEN